MTIWRSNGRPVEHRLESEFLAAQREQERRARFWEGFCLLIAFCAGLAIIEGILR